MRDTYTLEHRRKEISDFWFVVRDRSGASLSEGTVPAQFANIGSALDGVGQARLGSNLGDGLSTTARIKWMSSSAGEVQVLTGSGGSIPLRRIISASLGFFATSILPLIALTTLVTYLATPIVVRRAFKGVGAVAARAEQINAEQRGTRLPLDDVPSEIAPLVAAVNDALQRLDDGYEQQKRFFANVAHELRTPIAILQTRLDGLAPSADKVRLLEDVARLSTLAEQFLDLQRLNHHLALAPVDLVDIGRRVTSDLAPLAIAAGYQPAFETSEARIEVTGDRAALERAVTNLVQNAIQHGGRHGIIMVRVDRTSGITVTDEGDGVPAEDRERIFEPFHRLKARSARGFGLGLNLVQEIVQLHRATISVLDAPGGGAAFRITFPAANGVMFAQSVRGTVRSMDRGNHRDRPPNGATMLHPDIVLFARRSRPPRVSSARSRPRAPSSPSSSPARSTHRRGPVIELGPGTGVFTAALIARGVAESGSDARRIRLGFARCSNCASPKRASCWMDAARLAARHLFAGLQAGTVVSGLPLLNMTAAQSRRHTHRRLRQLRAGGALYQFTYGSRCPIPRPLLDRLGLKSSFVGRTLFNVPPAASIASQGAARSA